MNLIDVRHYVGVTVAACDEVYYRCYYSSFFFGSGTQSDLTSLIPHPPTYFTCPGLAWDAKDSGAASLEMFLGEPNRDEHSSTSFAAPLDDTTRELLLKSWCLQERLPSSKPLADKSNPLLTLWQSRYLENIRHIWTTHYAFVKCPSALKEALKKKHCDDHSDPLIRHETYGLSPAAETWRGSIRDYPANFYGYAVPTQQALKAVSAVLDNDDIVVEAGAGTGYLSALLASHLKKDSVGKVVFPYDITPPRQANAGAEVSNNEYHGQVPTFVDVHQAQSFEQAQSMLKSTCERISLLLCYPPPASEMAAAALSQHIVNGGETVIHLGEWQGMTGDEAFESMLRDNFNCGEEDIIPLPLWGTDATYLTIWRKKVGNSESTSFSPAIGYCSVAQCSNFARKRCRFARCLQYCSAECFQSHATVRRATLSIHMMHLSQPNDLNFENVNHFVPLSWVTGHHDEHGGQSRKKRRKKKHRK